MLTRFDVLHDECGLVDAISIGSWQVIHLRCGTNAHKLVNALNAAVDVCNKEAGISKLRVALERLQCEEG